MPQEDFQRKRPEWKGYSMITMPGNVEKVTLAYGIEGKEELGFMLMMKLEIESIPTKVKRTKWSMTALEG